MTRMREEDWATRRRQPYLLTASCCATSQVMPMLFKSCCIQFFRGLPGFLFEPLISQCTACLGSLLSSIHKTCPSHVVSSLFYDEIYLLQLCFHPDSLVTDFVFPPFLAERDRIIPNCMLLCMLPPGECNCNAWFLFVVE